MTTPALEFWFEFASTYSHIAAQRIVPILAMALEVGFGSIIAFNGAFKDKYGMTPTVCRAQRQAPIAR